MSRHSKKIIFLTPYPFNEAPSQRFRFEQYLPLLKQSGFKFTLLPFLNQSAWKILYGRNGWLKLVYILKALAIRPFHLFHALGADFVFIHREVAPMGPPVWEWVIAKILRKKIIYDFDDSIWLTDVVNESSMLKALRWRSKVGAICRWSYKVSCGNKYLQEYAMLFNTQAVINPTTIDTVNVHNPLLYNVEKNSDVITIGWTGSHSTLKYLYLLEPVLQQIQKRFDNVHMLVIADKEPTMAVKNLIFKKWSHETEVRDLLLVDIGIMPLPDDEWSKGKCGFKALQYMALEIPAIASPVGVNTEIIEHGVNGFLCSTKEEWVSVLTKLIEQQQLRTQIGAAGLATVVGRYSVESNATNFLKLFS